MVRWISWIHALDGWCKSGPFLLIVFFLYTCVIFILIFCLNNWYCHFLYDLSVCSNKWCTLKSMCCVFLAKQVYVNYYWFDTLSTVISTKHAKISEIISHWRVKKLIIPSHLKLITIDFFLWSNWPRHFFDTISYFFQCCIVNPWIYGHCCLRFVAFSPA